MNEQQMPSNLCLSPFQTLLPLDNALSSPQEVVHPTEPASGRVRDTNLLRCQLVFLDTKKEIAWASVQASDGDISPSCGSCGM
jgi:hypothetical protein